MPSEDAPKPAAPRRRPPDWQGRLLPRSVLGITALILAAALGAAFSGAVLYAYYEYRLDTNETSIDKYVNGVATSIKSVDLGAATYSNMAKLSSKITGYIDTLARFNGNITWGGPKTGQ